MSQASAIVVGVGAERGLGAALAKRFARGGHDSYRNPGIDRRKSCDLDGEGHRRPVPRLTTPKGHPRLTRRPRGGRTRSRE